MTLIDFLAALGGTQKAARAFATSPQAISNWKRRQRLPASRQLQALQIARKKRLRFDPAAATQPEARR
jgi:hypothetical protein